MATKLWLGNDSGNEGDWDTAANFSPSGVPANGDTVILRDNSQGVTDGFDQSAVALAALYIDRSFTGDIGDDDNYLQIGSALVVLGEHDGPGSPSGSGRIKLDLGSATVATVISHYSGTPTDTGQAAIRLLADNASTSIEVIKGTLAVAPDPGETSTVGTITVAYDSQLTNDADVFIGDGVTLTTLSTKGGQTLLQCAATTVNASAGELTTRGSGAITTLNATGATVISNSTGTVTTVNISGGHVNTLKSSQARTFTTVKLEKGGKLSYDPNVLTITNKVDSDNAVSLTAA